MRPQKGVKGLGHTRVSRGDSPLLTLVIQNVLASVPFPPPVICAFRPLISNKEYPLLYQPGVLMLTVLCTMYCTLPLESGKVLYASTGNFELHVCFNQALEGSFKTSAQFVRWKSWKEIMKFCTRVIWDADFLHWFQEDDISFSCDFLYPLCQLWGTPRGKVEWLKTL